MHAWIAIVVMTGNLPAQPAQTPTWLNSYREAQKLAVELKKPMAVFVGRGENGWDNVIRDGSLDASLKEQLKASYVCLYLDRTTAEGERIANLFAVGEEGVVLSNIGGDYQTYHQNGKTDRQTLANALKKYTGVKVAPSQTETIGSAPLQYPLTTTSNYGSAPTAPTAQPYQFGQSVPGYGGYTPGYAGYAPSYGGYSPGGFGGGFAPSFRSGGS